MAKQKKYVYVISQEHYTGDKDSQTASLMLGCRPILVRKDSGQAVAYAKNEATMYWNRFETGNVKDYTDNLRNGDLWEYRVWIDNRHMHAEHFVWVVRRVEIL